MKPSRKILYGAWGISCGIVGHTVSTIGFFLKQELAGVVRKIGLGHGPGLEYEMSMMLSKIAYSSYFLASIGFIFFLFGTYQIAKMSEQIYQEKTAPPRH